MLRFAAGPGRLSVVDCEPILATMKLDYYLARIAFAGPLEPDLATLRRLHRRHVLSVPFENLDVQLGIPLTTDVEAAYDKIVARGRGGWCYEQNGLLGWALAEIGFDVTRIAAAVRAEERGEFARANHLCLLVRADDAPGVPYLADVGFGGSLLEPIPLAAAEHEQHPYRIALDNRSDDRWRFRESAPGVGNYYDFRCVAADETALTGKCQELQEHPESSFVLNLVAQKRLPDAHVSLRGRVLTTVKASGAERRELETRDEWQALLEAEFGLRDERTAGMWPRINARHAEVLGAGKT